MLKRDNTVSATEEMQSAVVECLRKAWYA